MKTYIKHKNIYSGIICAMLMAVMVLVMHTTVYAASAKVSISSSNVTQGDEFEVIITIKADANIGAYNFYIDYDAEILEAVSGFNGGGNGRVQLMYYVPNTDVTSELTAKLTFKAKKPGTTSIKYVSISDDNGVIDFDTTDNMNVTATEGSVTVKAPYVASTNNYLSSLKVEAVKADGSTYSLDLSPAFSKDVTKYSAEAVEGVTKLVVSATQEDSKASIKTSGTKMDPGDNTTTITVTAEDGSTRKYVIYTAVAKPAETTTVPPEPITVQIDGTDSYIEDINDAVTLPEGFETFDYQYKDNTVVAAKGLVKNLIVTYVTKGDGSAGQLYVYDEAADTFYPMSNIQITQKLYTIVKEPEDIIIPDGFTETDISIGEQTFKGWVNSEVENIYLIYAMNWNGDSGLYYYDVNEEQVIRYFDIAVQTGVAVDSYNSLLSANEKLKDEINQLKADNNNEESGSVTLYKYLAFGCSIMAIIYLGIIIYLVVGKKKDDEEDMETDADVSEEEAPAEKTIVEEAPAEEATANAATEVETATETENTDAEVVDIEVADTEVTDTEVADTETTATEVSDTETTDTETTVTEPSSMEVTVEEAEEISSEEIVTPEEHVTEIIAENLEDTDFGDIDDEQDEIDDMLMDFEDIITGETEAAIAEETAEEIAEDERAEEDEAVEETSEFAEEIQPDIEAVIQPETEVTEEVEPAVEVSEITEEAEATAEVEEQPQTEEAVQATSDEKKKRVEQIMEDEENSISADDLDMVIDELFDDLFG